MAGSKDYNTFIKIRIVPEFKLSFWQAIKLRIAGKNYEPIIQMMLKILTDNLKKSMGDVQN